MSPVRHRPRRETRRHTQTLTARGVGVNQPPQLRGADAVAAAERDAEDENGVYRP
jgi:hypothetical protein